MTKGTIRVGIGGWDYDPWRNNFYPDGLAKAKQLAYAAERLTSIEINSTYYGSQKPQTFANWAKAAPDGFQFSVKAYRFATNRKILADGAESIARFLGQGIAELGDRLGPILWQFMATKKFDEGEFAAFLKLLPEKQDGLRLRHALEVRHDSFRDPAFFALARAANAAIVFADSDDFPEMDEPTADFAYARLQRSSDSCETGYDSVALGKWADRSRNWSARGDTYVYFISGAKARNPAAAMGLIEALTKD